jgi:hypothetical protein
MSAQQLMSLWQKDTENILTKSNLKNIHVSREIINTKKREIWVQGIQLSGRNLARYVQGPGFSV